MDGLTVGVEEEYQLVDPTSGALRPGIAEVLPTATAAVGDQVQPELHQSQIEIGTTVCRTLSEVRAELVLLRSRVAGAAEAEGFRLVAAGAHPFARRTEQRVTEDPTYEALAVDFGHLADELLVFGCHVHVAVADPELAIQVMNRVRPWLPALLACSASSPFWEGVDTSYASYRTQVFGRFPTTGIPSAFADRADYDAMVAELIATGAVDSPARVHADVRPSAKYPTLEIRAADVCTSVDDAVLLAGLVRGLVASAADEAQAGVPTAILRPELLRAAQWRAARYGLDADLIDIGAVRSAPAAEVLRSLVAFARPGLEDHGDWDEVRLLLDQVLARGTSARRQRSVLEQTGDLRSVVEWLVEETGVGT
jgi:carboxylate-amine ligase